MLISPPFLDGVDADPFDETYLDRLMPGTGDGFFPLSARLGWHGGIHLQAPRDAQGNAMPVRAIADGTVVLVRKPEREPSTPAEAVTKSKDENEPLGYDRGWTSNGAVVIKHTTDIGANGTTPVSVTFYSVYQHLHTIPTAAEGKAIWRKDIIGAAGYIAGQQDRIHFEIVMDKANVDKLIGNSGLIGPRNPAPPTAGRTDSIWGDIYFYVPAGLPVYGVDPRTQTQHYFVKQGDTPDSIASAFNTTVAKLKKLNHHEKDSEEIFTKWIHAKIPPPPPPQPAATPAGHGGHAPHHRAPPPPSPITVPQRYGGTTTAAPATPPATAPANPASQAPNTPPAAPAPDPNPPLAPIGQSAACRIAMKLFKTSIMTTTSPTGAAVGTAVTESGVSEYSLMTAAETFYPHCASAGYDLLRFGRVIGPDALHPDDANLSTHRHEHFREANVLMPDGTAKKGFIDLNATGVTVFSEADFSATDGWLLIDDDSDGDARCDSPLVYGAMYAAYLNAHGGELANDVIAAIHKLMTPKGQPATAPAAASSTPSTPTNAAPAQPPSLASLISDPAVKVRLSKIIVHSPSEWDKNLVDKRWAWLTAEKDAEALAAAQGDAAKKAATPSLQPDGTLTHPGYDKFVKHVQAVAFWEDGKIGLKSTDTWRFDPRQFIKMWRKCGWYSNRELAQLLPRKPGVRDFATATDRFETYYIDLNKSLRKYLLSPPSRFSQFLPQAYVETGLMRTVVEGTHGVGHDYGSFYGRGILQLTWAGNYASYGTYRNFPNNTSGTYADTQNPNDPITSTSKHAWSDGGDKKQWFPRYDPVVIATDTYDACDSSAYFWITKHYTGQSNINRLADTGFSTDTVGKTSVLINGGGNGYNEREGYGAFVYRYLFDDIDTTQTKTLSFVKYGVLHGSWVTHGSASTPVDFTPQRP